jgi:hypothetical protein
MPLHTPGEPQVGDGTWLVEQTVPQAPQFDASLLRFDSQPLSAVGKAGWAQFCCGATQVELQAPALHESVCTPDALHARPQPPQ